MAVVESQQQLPLLLALLLLGAPASTTTTRSDPAKPPVPIPTSRLGTGDDCPSKCSTCSCSIELDIDRGGSDVAPDGSPKGGGAIAEGIKTPTQESCCTYCRKIHTAILFAWESNEPHNCWCKSTRGSITASGPGTYRQTGSFAKASCGNWGWTLLVVLLVASVAYIGGGAGYNYKVKGLRGVELFPNQEQWRELRGLVADGAAITHSRVFGGQQQHEDANTSGGSSTITTALIATEKTSVSVLSPGSGGKELTE